jgi:hypothetical protein
MDLPAAARVPFDIEAHAARMAKDGYTVLPGLLDADGLAAVRTALAPHLGGHRGRNAFEGFATERIYTLVARGQVFEDLTEHPHILALLDRFLLPGYLLTASQAIAIQPGEAAQSVHYDDGFYRLPRPRPAASLSVIIAIDPFTAENGATDLLPGSHLWTEAEVEITTADEEVTVTLPPGEALTIISGPVNTVDLVIEAEATAGAALPRLALVIDAHNADPVANRTGITTVTGPLPGRPVLTADPSGRTTEWAVVAPTDSIASKRVYADASGIYGTPGAGRVPVPDARFSRTYGAIAGLEY